MRSKNRFSHERRSRRPWRNTVPPRRVLLMRLHALGDVAIVLPAVGAVARAWPEARIDFLTSPPGDSVARTIPSIRNVYVYNVAPTRTARAVDAFTYGMAVRRAHYDVIIDFQRNYITRLIRRVSGASAWSEFDRFSPFPAAERTLQTLSACGIRGAALEIPVPIRADALRAARARLRAAGWDGSTRLVVLNPAGLWPTRNWPLESYVELCRLWSAREPITVLILGTDRVRGRGEEIARSVRSTVINLAGMTDAGQAFALLRHADVIVTEDSGLMHMAWGSGIPLVALFGSTDAVWSSPTGDRAVVLDSRDLACGCCMEPACRFGDVRCLARRTPAEVLAAATALIERTSSFSGG
ncbi:MAG TPA: glycosyltransferase family 9 protein [Bacteroidota bacterium]|nr:glycosyltransferase family 9 protein [Bacteroidota bacterium]